MREDCFKPGMNPRADDLDSVKKFVKPMGLAGLSHISKKMN